MFFPVKNGQRYRCFRSDGFFGVAKAATRIQARSV